MTVHIVSWFHADSERFKSTYSQTLGDSASASHYGVYERCLRVLFASARRWNPGACLILVTNVPSASIFAPTTLELLDRLGVQQLVTPNRHETPPGYYGKWQNQFYVLDVAGAAVSSDDVADDDAILILDSDCVVTGPVGEQLLGLAGLAALVIDMEPDVSENGLTRADLTRLVEEFPLSVQRPEGAAPVRYFGGELIAARSDVLAKILARAEEGFVWSLERRRAGMSAFNEEAHLLSFAVQSLALEWRHADFIQRLWTQPWKFRTVTRGDAERTIWHLPAEKKTGLARLDRAARRPRGWFWAAPPLVWRARAGALVGVPDYHVLKAASDMFSLVRARWRARADRTR